jgi:hypothetical protein
VTPFEEILERYRTKCEDWGNMGRDAVLDQLTEVEDEILAYVAALEADKARLEWLEAALATIDLIYTRRPEHPDPGFHLFDFSFPRNKSRASGPTLRDAIDRARAAQQETPDATR